MGLRAKALPAPAGRREETSQDDSQKLGRAMMELNVRRGGCAVCAGKQRKFALLGRGGGLCDRRGGGRG